MFHFPVFFKVYVEKFFFKAKKSKISGLRIEIIPKALNAFIL